MFDFKREQKELYQRRSKEKIRDLKYKSVPA